MASIFTRIIQGEIPCYRIAEDEYFIAFLDIQPLVMGHVLVVPKVEEDKLFDLPSDYLERMLVFAQPVARAIEHSLPCKRCGISVIGLEVPHAHMHLVPIQTADDLNFTRAKLHPAPEAMKDVKDTILQALC